MTTAYAASTTTGTDLIRGTTVSLRHLIEVLVAERRADRLFAEFPALDPDDIRQALDRAAESGLAQQILTAVTERRAGARNRCSTGR